MIDALPGLQRALHRMEGIRVRERDDAMTWGELIPSPIRPNPHAYSGA